MTDLAQVKTTISVYKSKSRVLSIKTDPLKNLDKCKVGLRVSHS
jgi:hypothetical protein